MRVLQLTVHFSPNIGGVETHLDDLVSGLIEKKHDIFVLTYKPLTAKVRSRMLETGFNMTILRIPWITGFFYTLVQNPFLEFLYLLPGLFIATPLILLYFRPQVIHTHGLIAGFVGVFWGKIFGIRSITTTHSLYHFPESGIFTKFVKWIFSNSSKVLTLSKLSKIEIEKLGVESNKIQVFTYWVDLKKFSKVDNAKKLLGWNNKFVVLYAGRLVEEKGILVLLESLKSWNPKIFLALAGTGPLDKQITNAKSQMPNLLFLGKIDNDKLPIYYSAADLTIVPSIHDEGFGRVILESLACGTPVVGSNRGAIPEAMDESVGSLIEISSPNIAKKVNNYFVNKSRLTNLVENSVKFAKARYSEDNIETIINAYG